MRRTWIPLLSLSLLACAPELNWRDVTGPDGVLKAMLPCKPDRASREVQLGAQSYPLAVMGCEAAGATFAVSELALRDAAHAQQVQQLWAAYLQQSLRGGTGDRGGYTVPGADEKMLPTVLWQATGTMSDGRRMSVQSLWFARGDHLYQGLIQAPVIGSEMSEPFFGALSLP